jgi:hypothetical protein
MWYGLMVARIFYTRSKLYVRTCMHERDEGQKLLISREMERNFKAEIIFYKFNIYCLNI